MLLEEDHSIGAAGNVLIQSKHDAVPGPAWLVSLAACLADALGLDPMASEWLANPRWAGLTVDPP